MAAQNSVKKLFDDKYDNITEEKLFDLYSEWAKTYDEDVALKEEGYKGFIIIAKVVNLFAANNNIKILDVAAGTGLVAVELQKLNFFNLDALDACENMLNKAKERNLYKNYFLQMINEDADDEKHGLYDMVVIAGGFSKHHLNYRHIKNLVKYAKIGGYVAFTFRFEAIYGYQEDVPKEIGRLGDEGIVEIIMKTDIPNYYLDIPGYLAILRRKA